MKKKLALYLHIPFCRRKCLYCDFPSYAGREELIPDYLRALTCELREAFSPDGGIHNHPIDTIYFGGGTPSLLSGNNLNFLLKTIHEYTNVLSNAEFTIEANPGTVTREKLERIRMSGINRISFGAQCGDDRLLKTVGRIHSVREMEDSFQLARRSGFTNINLDLIFGLPGQNKKDWEKTLRWAVKLEPEHLTCYGLQVEEGTPLAAMINDRLLTLPHEDEAGSMYEFTMEYLATQDYLQYETVSYARKGFECRHNLYYWTYQDYLGVGAGAHSTISGYRWANVNLPDAYIKMIKEGRRPVSVEEHLGKKQEMVEMIMLGLRLAQGPDPDDFYRRWNVTLESVLGEKAIPLIKDGFLKFNNNTYTLTGRGKLVSNMVLQRLLEPIL